MPAPASTSPRTLAVVALAGAVLMALEILALRILSPSFGSGVYVWGAVLSVFLAAMSGGYLLGGRVADRRPELPTLGTLLLLAALGIGPLIGSSFALADRVARWTDGRSWGPLVAAALLFGPATALLATASPFAVRLAARELATLGHVAGRLWAVSTVGSLAGTLLATFVLIPRLELDSILVVLTASAAAAGVIAHGRSLARRAEGPLLLAAALVVLALSWAGGRAGPAGDLVERRLSPYQTLEVVERGGRRILLSNGQMQAAIDLATAEPALRYARAASVALLFHDHPREVLLLGLGGGSVAEVLRAAAPGLVAEHVEIDPAVVELAVRHFGFEPGPREQVHVDDARRFLRRSERRWDLIVADTYVGLSIPFHLATREMFELVERRLAPDGALVLNLAAPLEQPFARAVWATVASVYPRVWAFRVPGASGTLVIATGEPAPDRPDPTLDELRARARRLDARLALEPSLGELLDGLLEPPSVAPGDVLRDAWAPVDRLLDLRAR
ncbi:MAG TPA: fused MFS/spermidine synthase [Thermoanaerobaculia bacterium]|nr:fused MFS/spermidine synthase [Thermoanaerobaculia bacterium]